VLAQPLSFWGGFDAATGRIVDRLHPQHGAVLTGHVLVMPSGRGSSSSSSVLAEAIRRGTAPIGIVLAEPDGIIAVGAAVAEELYGRRLPVVVLPPADCARLRTGQRLRLAAEASAATVTLD
jgi:predicted aconitase with swiveling domain